MQWVAMKRKSFLISLSANWVQVPYISLYIFHFKLCLGYNKDKIQTGVFGAMMKVELENDGPVTIEVNSPEQKPDKSKEEKTEWFFERKTSNILERLGWIPNQVLEINFLIFLENGGSYTISTDISGHPKRLHYKSSGSLLGTIQSQQKRIWYQRNDYL